MTNYITLTVNQEGRDGIKIRQDFNIDFKEFDSLRDPKEFLFKKILDIRKECDDKLKTL